MTPFIFRLMLAHVPLPLPSVFLTKSAGECFARVYLLVLSFPGTEFSRAEFPPCPQPLPEGFFRQHAVRHRLTVMGRLNFPPF